MIPLAEILRSIQEQPTAPFHEEAVAREIERLLAPCPHVTMECDPFGNRVARYRRGNAGEARLAFVAHMDHPGWVKDREKWTFLGGVPPALLDKAAQPTGPGPFAMWDLPAFELRDGIVHSRACDDLAGCAALVALLLELEAAQAEADCIVLFTRAEECGFVGAVEAARSGTLPKSVTVLSLETSAARPPAVMGEGVIVRVGDRTSVFDPAITAELTAVATERAIAFQRCLMSGGTCEATAFALYGYRCGALCVALGNYHNIGPDDTVAPEFIALSDLRAMTDLCLALLQTKEGAAARQAEAFRLRIEGNLEENRRFFRPLP